MFLILFIQLLIVRNINTLDDEIISLFEFDLEKTPKYFEEFEHAYGPRFESDSDREQGYEQFAQNLKRAYFLNKLSETAKHGVNEFSHLSLPVFTSIFTGFNDTGLDEKGTIDFTHKNVFKGYPPSFTLKSLGLVLTVRMQTYCKSSYVQAAMSLLETQCALTLVHMLVLSAAQGFECEETGSCINGGMPHLVLEAMMKQGGVAQEMHYPDKFFTIAYDNKTCKVDPKAFVLKITGVYRLKVPDEDVMLTAFFSYGTLITAIYVSESVKSYKFGILDPTDCDHKPNHNVVIIGYGVIKETDIKYWHILNSWGPLWGEAGYMRLRRGHKTCGIGSYVVTTSVDTMYKHNVSTPAPVIPPNLPEKIDFGEKGPTPTLRNNNVNSRGTATVNKTDEIPLKEIPLKDIPLKVKKNFTNPIPITQKIPKLN